MNNEIKLDFLDDFMRCAAFSGHEYSSDCYLHFDYCPNSEEDIFPDMIALDAKITTLPVRRDDSLNDLGTKRMIFFTKEVSFIPVSLWYLTDFRNWRIKLYAFDSTRKQKTAIGENWYQAMGRLRNT